MLLHSSIVCVAGSGGYEVRKLFGVFTVGHSISTSSNELSSGRLGGPGPLTSINKSIPHRRQQSSPFGREVST